MNVLSLRRGASRPAGLAARLMKPLFEVSPSDVPSLADADPASTARLLQVVGTVTECCHLTLFHSRFDQLVPRLDRYETELRGFAYEGAGVGYAALDSLMPWKRRTQAFLDGPGRPYAQAIYLGAGMGLARIGRNPERFRTSLADPIFSWVVLDGYGFHEGFFAHRKYVIERRTPTHLGPYARRAFDHGLGRAIWFATGADVGRVGLTIGSFPAARRPDLWAGVGLACGYTGGVDCATVEELRTAAGSDRSRLAVGATIAALARYQVGNPAAHNEFACQVLCELTSSEVAALAEAARRDLPDSTQLPGYEVWRERIRQHFV